MVDRKAFTLIEVLISIALMGIIIVALFSSVDMLQNSNTHLLKYLKKSKKITQATKTLYTDIINSDGNITIVKDEFSRVCIGESRNSLYALPSAKVCWMVLKKDKTLVRVEGNNYHLPLLEEERVEVDSIMENVSIFDVYKQKDKILVLLQQADKEPITFMIQGLIDSKKLSATTGAPLVDPNKIEGTIPVDPSSPSIPKATL